MVGEDKVWGPRTGKNQVPEGRLTTLSYPPFFGDPRTCLGFPVVRVVLTHAAGAMGRDSLRFPVGLDLLDEVCG